MRTVNDDREVLLADMKKVEALLIRKRAKDLIPMLLPDPDDLYPVNEALNSINGARKNKKK